MEGSLSYDCKPLGFKSQLIPNNRDLKKFNEDGQFHGKQIQTIFFLSNAEFGVNMRGSGNLRREKRTMNDTFIVYCLSKISENALNTNTNENNNKFRATYKAFSNPLNRVTLCRRVISISIFSLIDLYSRRTKSLLSRIVNCRA